MDREEVLHLLTIADLSKQWPNLKPVHDAAMAKLEEHAKEVKVTLDKKRADEAKAAEAKAAQAAATQEKPKWQDQSSQNTAPTLTSPRPLVRPPVA